MNAGDNPTTAIQLLATARQQPTELIRRTLLTGCCHDAGCDPMHAGGLKPDGTLRRYCEPMTMRRWSLSQLMKES
jgi:hypothetical protein